MEYEIIISFSIYEKMDLSFIDIFMWNDFHIYNIIKGFYLSEIYYHVLLNLDQTTCTNI